MSFLNYNLQVHVVFVKNNISIVINSFIVFVYFTGYFGAPLDVCVQSFYDALRLFTIVHDKKVSKHLQEILLVSNDQDSACSSVVVFRSLMDLDDDLACNAAIERYSKGSDKYDFSAHDFHLENLVPKDGEHPEINQNGKNDISIEDKKSESNQLLKLDSGQSKAEESCASSSERGDVYQPRSFPANFEEDSRGSWGRSKVERTNERRQNKEMDSLTLVKPERKSGNEYISEELESDLRQLTSQASFSSEFKDDAVSSSVVERMLKSYGENKTSSAMHFVSSSDEDDIW